MNEKAREDRSSLLAFSVLFEVRVQQGIHRFVPLGVRLFDHMALNGGQPFEFLADGNVIKTTEMLALNIYNTFYQNSNSRGVGQAKAVIFFLLVAALGLIQLNATRKKEVQQ